MKRIWLNRWSLLPVVMLAGTIAFLAVTVSLAVATHDVGSEPAYDTKAAAFETERVQRARNDELRWILTPRLGRTTGRCSIEIVIEDKHSVPIDASRVRVECIPHLRAGARVMVELVRLGRGEFAGDFPADVDGWWDFRVRVEAGEKVYTDSFRRQLSVAQSQVTP